MVAFVIRTDLDKLLPLLQADRKRINTSAAIALTRVAKSAQAEIRTEMQRVFDRPTPYALNSTYVKPATPSRLTSEVGIKDQLSAGKGTAGIKFLSPQIYGGERGMKRFEKALQARGLMPVGMYAVPGGAAKLDAYGNMAASQIRSILSALGAAETYAGYSANRTQRSRKRNRRMANYFVGRPGGGRLPLGVWQVFRFAMGSAVKPVVIFTKAPRYKIRLQFQDIVERVFDRDFNAFFADALAVG